MNQRIRELAEQASINVITRRPYIDEEPDGYLESDNDFVLNNYEVAVKLLEGDLLEKFAELIVRECVQTLINNTPERYTNESAEEDWDKGYDRAMKDCVHHIQEHFGVEEK